jgi:hypothetical protein
MPTRSSQRFRRWLRYLRTVRGLTALVVIMALGLAWEAHRTRVQRSAVATIRAADGSVKYNWEWRDGEPIPDAKPPAPEQIVEFIGVDHFGTVKAVELFPRSRPAPEFSAEDRANLESALDSVKTLPQAELVNLLDLSGTEISDLGLAHLKGLTGLRSLKLSKTKVTDAGLVHLRGLTYLAYLEVCETTVTPYAAHELEQCLPSLTIRRCYF